MKKNDIKKWLDGVIDAQNMLYNLIDGPSGIAACCGIIDQTQIYQGIEKIAAELEIPIIYNPNWDQCVGRAYFYYRGREIFQLWKKEEI